MSEGSRRDFYIGYRSRAPRALARFLRHALLGLAVAGAALAALLALLQAPFDPGAFEFGVVREFTGVVLERPYPALLVNRPGGAPEAPSVWSLVAFGKRGAAREVAGLDGRRVRLEGSLIHREGETMIEILPGSLSPEAGGRAAIALEIVDLGEHTLTGEIVDTKCYLGVMKPGRGKTHRGCATLCIRGGIPPALMVEAPHGEREIFFLLDADGGPVGERLLDLVAEPVAVTGRVSRRGERLELAADPAAYRRLSQ